MSLSDYAAPSAVVEYRGKPLVTVRGLNVEDAASLIRDHLSELTTFFGSFDAANRKLLPSPEEIDTMLFSLVTKFPRTAAKAIALAVGEPENIAKAMTLSAPLQMKILIEVVKLTFEDVGGPLAFAALLKPVLASVESASPTIQ